MEDTFSNPTDANGVRMMGTPEESQETSESLAAPSFIDLPWEQVLCTHVLPYLSISDLFHLRAVSLAYHDLIRTHFSLLFEINTSPLKDNFSADAFEIMSRDCQSLKILSARGAKSWLTKRALLNVVASNPRLEKIDFSGCSALSGETVYSIGVKCQHLKYLSLRDCVCLNQDNFLSFLRKGQCLEFLDLSGCWNLNDDLIVHLVHWTPSLKHLLLAKLYGLTDRSVGAIAHSCPNLVQLSIKGCWRVTDWSIKLLEQYCLNLKFLHIKECRDITENSLASLRSRKVVIDKLPPAPDLFSMLHQGKGPPRLNIAL